MTVSPVRFVTSRVRPEQVREASLVVIIVLLVAFFATQIDGYLSGGNQQKIVLGKWLAMNPKVLILDEPTRGIDVGAKSEIYQHMAELAKQGITILMVSSDMEEVIGMSDRVVVMHERRLKGVLGRHELTQERIATLMTGRAAAPSRRRRPRARRADARDRRRQQGPDLPADRRARG